jgi:hypothetical protein
LLVRLAAGADESVRERIDQLKLASDGWGEATANTSRP